MEMDDGFDSIAEIVDVGLVALFVGGMFVESFDDVVLGASLDNAELLVASLDNAELLGASLDNAELLVVSLDNAELLGASLDNAELLVASCLSCDASAIELTEFETFSIGSTDISITEPSCPSFAPSFASRDSSSTSSSEWRYLRTFALSVSSSS